MRWLAASRDLDGGISFEVGALEDFRRGLLRVKETCQTDAGSRLCLDCPAPRPKIIAQRPNSPLWGSDRDVVDAMILRRGLAALTV
jgi:hypothetical protein